MPGTNAGTGQPITMRCGWCRQHTGVSEVRRGYTVTVTGRIAPLTKQQRKNGGGPRLLGYRVEYRCGDCGRTGWSRHSDMQHKLRKVGIDAPSRDGSSVTTMQIWVPE